MEFMDRWSSQISGGDLTEAFREMRIKLIHSGLFRFLDAPIDRIYSFASPLMVEEHTHQTLTQSTLRLRNALDLLGRRFLRDKELAHQALLFRSGLDEELFFQGTPPLRGGPLVPCLRMDMALDAENCPRLLEINAGCPGGEADPLLIYDAFKDSSIGRLARRLAHSLGLELSFHDPVRETLSRHLCYYRAFRELHPNLPERPAIALVTSSPQARFMIPECRVIAHIYKQEGYSASIGDLFELNCNNGVVSLRGRPVHLVIRKFSTNSLKRRMEDEQHFGRALCKRVRGFWDAYLGGSVCISNPPGSTYLQDKAVLGPLREMERGLEVLIPETHLLDQDLPCRDQYLWRAICSGEEFVVKRRQSFSGRHVILEPALVREMAPRLIREDPGQWVAQGRVDLAAEPFAMLIPGGKVQQGRFPFVVSPFGESSFVRVAIDIRRRPIAAHSGSAETCQLVSGVYKG